MAVTINNGFGLVKGGNVYIKQLDKGGNWVTRGTVKDGSIAAGNKDSDRRPASVTYGGGANLTTYVQVDNDGRAGDTDVFWRVVQDARGNVVSSVKQVPLTVTGAQGMKAGARIDIWSGDGKKLLNTATDQSGKDLDRSGNVKFSTLATKGADYRVNIYNKGARTPIQLRYENVGMPGGGNYVLPPQTWINDVRAKGDLLTRFFNANGGNQARMIADIKKNGGNPQTTAYGAVKAVSALTLARGGNVKLTNGQTVSWEDAKNNAGNAATNWDKNAGAFLNVYTAWKAATATPVVPQITKNAVLSAFTEFKAVARSLSVSQPIGLPADLGVGPVSKFNLQAIGRVAEQAGAVMNSYNELMDKIKSWPGTRGQLNEALGDPNWLNTIEGRLTQFRNNTKTALQNYANEISRSVDVTRRQEERDRAYAIVNIAASSLWFAGGALGAIGGIRAFFSTNGTANSLIAGLGGVSSAAGAGMNGAKEAGFRMGLLKGKQAALTTTVDPKAFRGSGKDITPIFWDIEAKVGKRLGFYELSQAGFGGNYSGIFADRKVINKSDFKNAGGPGWNNTYGLHLTVNDQQYLGFADNYRDAYSVSKGNYRTHVRDSVKRWLVPYGV